MRFSLRHLFIVTALVAIGLWWYLHLAVRLECRPMTYANDQFRWDYSVIVELH